MLAVPAFLLALAAHYTVGGAFTANLTSQQAIRAYSRISQVFLGCGVLIAVLALLLPVGWRPAIFGLAGGVIAASLISFLLVPFYF